MRSSVISLGVLFMPGFAHAQAEATPSVRSRLPSDSSVWGMFAAADWPVQAVMVGLVVASVMTWTVVVAKSLEIASTARQTSESLELVVPIQFHLTR